MNMQEQVDAFNKECPVGTAVVVTRDNGKEFNSRVRRPAVILQGHTPVVWLEWIAGAYLLARVKKAKETTT